MTTSTDSRAFARPRQPRASVHVEPHGVRATARHYIGDLVYGANDGIVTTFAVVAGVAGGALSSAAVLIVGAANLAADGLSMAAGNFLAIRAHESAREADNLPEEESHPAKHAAATFIAFVTAGAVPLVPYLLPVGHEHAFTSSALATMAALFSVGAARSSVTVGQWWRSGLEMLGLGIIVAAVAYGAGALIASLTLSR
jgi:vacuolar iron transporter family protein